MLNLDQVFAQAINKPSARRSSAFPGLQRVRFPAVTISPDGDKYFESLWRSIDGAKGYVWVVMYHFDDTRVGKITLHKLVEAAKRGVNVCVLHDVLTSELDPGLARAFVESGGADYRLNAMHRIWNIPTRRYFKRDHEKLIVADEAVFLGSANISVDYAHKKHGLNFFYDLNMWSSHVCLEKVRSYVRRVADWHEAALFPGKSNAEAVQHFDALFPSSPYAPRSLDILTAFQPDDTEIQRYLLEKVQTAKRKIQIISPYYYPLKKLDKELLSAAARGVQVELITARNRDIPSYRDFVNANLMNHLVKNGVRVLQVRDKYLHMKGFLFDEQDLTFGSFNLDKWSWDNNNELNFCSREPEHVERFKQVYAGIRSETVPVESTPVAVKFARRAKIAFWEFFLASCNFFMNYRNKFKFEHTERSLRRLWREEVLDSKKAKLPIPEDSIRLYKCVNFDWDDTIGIEH